MGQQGMSSVYRIGRSKNLRVSTSMAFSACEAASMIEGNIAESGLPPAGSPADRLSMISSPLRVSRQDVKSDPDECPSRNPDFTLSIVLLMFCHFRTSRTFSSSRLVRRLGFDWNRQLAEQIPRNSIATSEV